MKLSWFAIFLVTLGFGLSGCDFNKQKNITEICQQYPQMCQGFNRDGWCKSEIAEVIYTRHQQLTEPSDANRYKLLLNFESYRDCVQKATMIEHLKLKEKKNPRLEGLMMARQQLSQLAENTKYSSDPALSYYHWSRSQDKSALRRFLQAADEGRLNTPALQVNLAEYYSKVNVQETIKILFNALSLYPKNSDIDGTIFDSLSTLYMGQNNLTEAYMWAILAQQHHSNQEKSAEVVSLSQLEAVLRQANIDLDSLEKIAEQRLESIEDGQFIPPS